MSVRPARPTLLLALLALAALLALPTGAAAAKGKNDDGTSVIAFSLPGTKGWEFEIGALPTGRPGSTEVGVTAKGDGKEAVTYGVRGKVDQDGSIDAKFPGIGKIDVHFEATNVKKTSLPGSGKCKSEGEVALSKGFFRGTIKLRGQGGFSSVDRSVAPGEILAISADPCRTKHVSHAEEEEEEELVEKLVPEPTTLDARRQFDGGTLSFTAISFESFGLLKKKGVREIEFGAAWTQTRHGLTTTLANRTSAGATGFTFGPAGATPPTEATVEPPAPFNGSAAFKLESPTRASWTGDLSVELPILGTVSLTEPDMRSALCEGETCTKTLPPGLHVGPLGEVTPIGVK